MKRWTFTKFLYLVWRASLWGYDEDRKLIAKVATEAMNIIWERNEKSMAEIEARRAQRKAARQS